MYAYIMGDTGESKIFKNPIDFYAKGRKFEVLRQIEDSAPGIPVKGSKGDTYYVTNNNNNYKCTCVGFKYHGTCKHIETVKTKSLA